MFWYEDEIKRLEKQRSELTTQPETLFYGSSSIRLWTSLATDFADINPVNLGFGGSTLAACTWFFDRVMNGYEPKRLIFYAGDNDLSDGRHPEEVFIFFQEFTTRIIKRFGHLPCYFISLKPSINRSNLLDQFRYTNELIFTEIRKYHPTWQWIDVFSPMLDNANRPDPSFYTNDGLHMNEKGYQLWKNTIKNKLISI